MGHAMVVGGARATAPIGGLPLRDIATGQTVKLNENGSLVEFYVSCHNYESSLNGEGRTLLVRKELYGDIKWNTSQYNAYSGSNIDTWFNGTYKNLLDSNVQDAIGTTTFSYTPGGGNNTVSSLTRSIFALSLTELGKSHSYANIEGSALPISSVLLIAYKGGSADQQWLRTPYKSSQYASFYVDINGSYTNGNPTSLFGARPCFTLPGKAKFDEKTLTFKGV